MARIGHKGLHGMHGDLEEVVVQVRDDGAEGVDVARVHQLGHLVQDNWPAQWFLKHNVHFEWQ